MKWVNVLVSAAIMGAAIWAATLVRDGAAMAFDVVRTTESIRAQAFGQELMGVGYLVFVAVSACSFFFLRPRWIALGAALPAAVGTFASLVVTPMGAGLISLLAVPVALIASAAGVVVCLTSASIVDECPEPVQLQEPTLPVSV